MTIPFRVAALLGARSFDPSALFMAGEVGAWYDPSDLTSMFQDSAGTTAAALEAPVGLMLDKSKGLALGSELVTNGGFENNVTGWPTTGTASVSWSDGRALVTSATNFDSIRQALTYTAGKTYKVTATVERGTSAAIRIVLDNFTGSPLVTVTQSGIQTVTFYGSDTDTTGFIRIDSGAGTGTFYVHDVSVREIAGNHASQATSTSFRPVAKATPSRLNFDASDDRILSVLNPTGSGSLAVRILGGTASRVAIGSQGATNGRAFIGLAADGAIAAGIGADTTSTIKGSVDARSAWTTGVVTWDGSTVNLYANGISVYSVAQNGAVNTTIPFTIGSLNNNSTAQAFWDGGIGAAIVLNRAMTASEVKLLHGYWRSIA